MAVTVWSVHGLLRCNRLPVPGVLTSVSLQQTRGGGAVGPEFDRFVASASPGLLKTAYLLTGDTGEAEDLLQSALLRVFRRWGAISESPTAYAFTVLMNLSRDHRRWRHRQRTWQPNHRAHPLLLIRSGNCWTARRLFKRLGGCRSRSRR